jgi:hypothetical protein
MNGSDLRTCVRAIEVLHEQLRLSIWSPAERATLELDLAVANFALAAAKQALTDDGFVLELVDGMERQYIAEYMEGIPHDDR